MIIKRVENGIISIYPDGVLQVREDYIIDEDGIELSRIFNQVVYNPSLSTDNITNPIVKKVAQLIWTPAVVAAYLKKIADLVNVNG